MKHHYFQNNEVHYRWSQCTRGIQKLHHQCRRDSFEKYVCKHDVQIWGGKREQNRKTTLIRLINLTLVNFIQLYNYTTTFFVNFFSQKWKHYMNMMDFIKNELLVIIN